MRLPEAIDRRALPLFPKGALRMTYTTLAAAWFTGGAWLALHYFMRRQGELGIEPHPLEPWTLKLHGASAFAALWLAGFLWSSHLVPAWQRIRPASGIILAVLFGGLIVSGYLLYYLGGESWRAMVAIAHWLVGLGLPLSLIWHLLDRRRGGMPPSM